MSHQRWIEVFKPIGGEVLQGGGARTLDGYVKEAGFAIVEGRGV